MLKRFLQWFDHYGLLSVTIFLIIFIPLYPKIPLFQPVPGYIVRIRLEDVAVLLGCIVYGVQLLRRKISWHTPLNVTIGLYLLASLISLAAAFFVLHTLPLLGPHINKALLHWVRYVEYFSLFFMVYTAAHLRRAKQLLIMAFCLTIVLVTIYGVGQKYFRWPVYSTMNWEFSKGIALELVSNSARVQSTFAGHYDFAIYLTVVLPLVLASLYVARRRVVQVALAVVFACGVWSLIVSGLRSAFVAYGVTITIVTALMAMPLASWRAKLRWIAPRLGAVYIVTAVFFLLFGQNLQQLLKRTINGATGRQEQSIDTVVISQYEIPLPKDAEEVALIQDRLGKPQSLSGCALKYELSVCIRLESLWPQAIRGFLRSPLVGSGFSSLNKRDFLHLSEADGTDGNYLRILGETGALGFLTFFSIISMALVVTWRTLKSRDEVTRVLAVAYIASTAGMLLNALLFDVFVASKVAFTFWALTGLVLASVMQPARMKRTP